MAPEKKQDTGKTYFGGSRKTGSGEAVVLKQGKQNQHKLRRTVTELRSES